MQKDKKRTPPKFNAYSYSSGTHPFLHECITQRTDREFLCKAVCVRACPVCAPRSRGSENNVTPKGSHLSSFLPSFPMPPPEWAPTGISFRSSEEMSDLFHHRSHKDWTVASLQTSRKLQTLTLCLDIKSAVRTWENHSVLI